MLILLLTQLRVTPNSAPTPTPTRICIELCPRLPPLSPLLTFKRDRTDKFGTFPLLLPPQERYKALYQSERGLEPSRQVHLHLPSRLLE